MTHNQDSVKQLQRRLSNWEPDEKCKYPYHEQFKQCEYDKQGRLIQLHLCRLKLAQVPSDVWQFLSLQGLHLHGNQLSSLPAELGQLSALQTLHLDGNQLSSLPAELGQLSALQRLDLSFNKLSTLPVELGQLSALQRLDLDSNQLSSLPAELGQLSALQQLYLSFNKLSTLPVELGQLSALQRVWLDSNPLSSLPAEIGQLSSLQELFLGDNPVQIPPPEIIAQGTPAILAHLRTLLPIKIFYCYAHEDKDLRDHIDKHLGVLMRSRQIVRWYDREIQAGTEWKREIERNLSSADLILLLVSADFVHSDYCYGVEMQKALELHRTGKVRVLPILLRPVDWQDAPFAELQMLPTGAKPITQWKDPDEALEDVAKGIRAIVRTLRAQKSV